jgi:UDP-3-O-[3-hydroxymyristoyl] glucosamine N-acyltransferase
MQKCYTLAELAAAIGAEVRGNGERKIIGLSDVGESSPDSLRFIDSRKRARDLPLEVAVVADAQNFPDGYDGLKVASFRAAMAKLLYIFEPRYEFAPCVSPMSFIAPGAKVHETAYIGPNCTISNGAVIGKNVKLIANVYVGPDAEIGDDSVLEPMVVVQRRTKIGKRCLLHSCAVIGTDGFGIIPGGPDGINVKIPQIGRVVLGDDVEVGACTCVDRATIAETSVQSGTKIDNQVQIGHNCKVGKNCIICSQSGVAGSTSIGDGVIMGARSGLNGHINIARGTQIAGVAIVMKDTKPGQILSGHPAIDHMEDYRFRASLRRVPELLKSVKELERKINDASDA